MEEVIKGVSKDELAKLKAKHGKLHLVVLNVGKDKVVKGIFKKPDIDVLSMVAVTAQTDPVGASVEMYKNCKVVVEPEMETDEELKLSAAKQVGTLFKRYSGEVKEL